MSRAVAAVLPRLNFRRGHEADRLEPRVRDKVLGELASKLAAQCLSHRALQLTAIYNLAWETTERGADRIRDAVEPRVLI